jgi:hypothetical protein
MRDLEARIGRAPMERAFKEYYRRWKFRHPSTADLRETLAEVTGQRAAVEDVFAQQVYAVSRVDDRIADVTQPRTAAAAGLRRGALGRGQGRHRQARRRRPRGLEEGAIRRTEGRPLPVPHRGAGAPLRRRGAADAGREVRRRQHRDRALGRRRTLAQVQLDRPARAVSAELDPQRLHYLDASKLDDSRTLDPDRRASRRWGIEFAAFFEYLLTLIATV